MRKPTRITKLKSAEIDPYVGRMLENITEGKEILELRKDIKVFGQGDQADEIYFIQSGRVEVTVASVEAKEAVLAILGPGQFFGEGCLVGQSLRVYTATTTASSKVFEIRKRAMLQAFQAQPELSERFIASLLVRNIDVEEDICNQLFNQDEKRLAHVLLKLNRYGRADFLPDAKLSHVSEETLADLVGTTPSQISLFLDKFKKLGLIYDSGNGEIMVRAAMLTDMVLHV
jgi:CRP/FNR family cyclic AMP-dependent transcriptional regulator